MPTTPAILTTGLSKRFETVHALDGLDLTVEQGEIFGYLGPNGAGKTTTIRLLLDFLRPTSGRSSVLGGTGADPAIRARIGYLPAELSIDPHYTTGDLLTFYGRLHGGYDPKRVARLLEWFDLDPRRPVGELSTGNRRKAGIVAAFAHRPELLILDEPTSGLDPLLQHAFQKLVRESVADGATVFLSSHVLPEVELLADRVAILRAGRLVTVAGVDELRRQARQRIDLTFAAPPDPGHFQQVPGVVQTSAVDSTVQVVVEGSAAELLKAAAPLNVVRIVTHEADLDEVFLSYYQETPS